MSCSWKGARGMTVSAKDPDGDPDCVLMKGILVACVIMCMQPALEDLAQFQLSKSPALDGNAHTEQHGRAMGPFAFHHADSFRQP